MTPEHELGYGLERVLDVTDKPATSSVWPILFLVVGFMAGMMFTKWFWVVCWRGVWL